MKSQVKPRRSVRSSILSSGVVGIATIVLNLVSIPLVFSSIGPADYGVWLLLTAVATFIYQADIGVGSAVMYRVAAASGADERSSVASSSLAWMSLVSLLAIPIYWFSCILLAQGGTELSTSSGGDAGLLPVLGCVLVGSIWLRLFSTLLPALGLWTLERGFQMVALAVRFLGTLYVVFFDQSILLLAMVETFALLLPGVLAACYVLGRKLVDIRLSSFSLAETRRLLAYSTKSFSVSLASNAVLQAGPVLVGVIGTPTDVSFYTAASRIYGGAKQALSWVIDPFVPALSRIKADVHTVRGHLLSLCTVSLLMGSMLSCGLLICADVLVYGWLQDNDTAQAVSDILKILLIGLALNSSHLPANPVGNAMGRPGAFLYLYVLWAVTGIGFGVWWGSLYGAPGVAAGMAAPLILLQPLFLLRMKSVLQLQLRRWIVRACVPAIVFTSVSLGVAAIPLLIIPSELTREIMGTLVFLLTYSALLVVFRRLIGIREVRSLLSLGA